MLEHSLEPPDETTIRPDVTCDALVLFGGMVDSQPGRNRVVAHGGTAR
ncbi:MAG TPA: hypothetical protein VLM85_16135 [Polyangiaceae bacterium]|nr:hypothetical protein [Polyangiaceae bacterium]